MIELLTKRLHDYRPRRIPGRNLVTRCGVVILIAEQGLKKSDAMPTILMMQRAERAGDPWSGDVSFPGGKQDASDANTRAAALRELHEKLDLLQTVWSRR